MKKLLSLLFAVIMTLSFAACGEKGGGSGTSDGVEKDTLTVACTQDYATLDFTYESAYGDYTAISRMYAEPLYDIYKVNDDGTYEYRWILATSMEEESDTSWVFHLREGVKFSNGNDFNADDVLFTLDLCCNTDGQYPYFPHLDWEACEKIDDYTVRIVFKQFDYSYYNNVCTMQILDAETYDPVEYATNPVGTGPYVVTDYVVNSYLNMTANENYWGEQPKIKNLNFLCMDEDTQRVNALETDSVDVCLRVPLQELDYVSSLGDYEVLSAT